MRHYVDNVICLIIDRNVKNIERFYYSEYNNNMEDYKDKFDLMLRVLLSIY
jgi:hypothetical protein